MTTDFWGFGCLSLVCLAPIGTFVLGVLVGKNRLPYRVRIERTGSELARYEVDDGGDYHG